jgi:hypothetical protein
MQDRKSLLSYFVCCLILGSALIFYYPKWKQNHTEATLSWDVSGYYFYLPAIFIYQDIKGLSFKDQILQQYQPTGDFQQGYQVPNGNFVLKYSCGQAILYAPAFFIAHLWASLSDQFPNDGFSHPYQFSISLYSLLFSFLGLFVLRRILLRYYADIVVAFTLIILVLGTNYLEYATMSGAMTHNYLFTLYALLIAATIRFYEKPGFKNALAIGGLVGLGALIRPTEILMCLIPVLWGIEFPLLAGVRKRIQFLLEHWKHLALAVIVCGLIGFTQLAYWKYVTGEWLVYSYGDQQGFSWLRPHLKQGLFSYRSGWLVYTPLMIFSLIGIWHLFREKKAYAALLLLYSLVFIYVTFAWDIWWYGGSLGQRAMVQAYALLALPLAAFIQHSLSSTWWKYGFVACLVAGFYLNLWWTHQAHRGGMFMVEQMNCAYFWKVLGRLQKPNEEVLKLIDTNSPNFDGIRSDLRVLASNDFEKDSTNGPCEMPPIQGQKSFCLGATQQHSPELSAPLASGDASWVRGSGVFRCKNKEWNIWLSAQLVITFFNGDEIAHVRKIRLYRFLNDGQTKPIFLDVKAPKKAFTRVGMQVWNAEGTLPLAIDELKLEAFNQAR